VLSIISTLYFWECFIAIQFWNTKSQWWPWIIYHNCTCEEGIYMIIYPSRGKSEQAECVKSRLCKLVMEKFFLCYVIQINSLLKLGHDKTLYVKLKQLHYCSLYNHYCLGMHDKGRQTWRRFILIQNICELNVHFAKF